MTRLLVVGIPRSGSTWIGKVLGCTQGTAFVKEPDGDHEPFAYRMRRELGNYPDLACGDSAVEYERLFDGAFAGGGYRGGPQDRIARWLYRTSPIGDRWTSWLGAVESVRLRTVRAMAQPLVSRPEADHVLVKSVRAEFSMEWLVDRYQPHVLVVHRNPLNILASWVHLGFERDPRQWSAFDAVARRRWQVEPPPPEASLLRRQAFAIGVLIAGLAESRSKHDDWRQVTHEALCIDSAARFRELAESLGLTWTRECENLLVESNSDGTRYETRRLAADLPQLWRERLTAAEVQEARAEFDKFPYDLFASEPCLPE